MSNLGIGGGAYVSAEWVNAGDTTPKRANEKTADEQTRPVFQNVNNMADLRKAEQLGDHYTVSDEQIVKAIEKAIRAIQGKTTTLEFSIHKKTNLIAVKVKDADTGEVIREIPPEKTLDFVANLWEMAGVLIDERR
jgi:flagellar protein FlaG